MGEVDKDASREAGKDKAVKQTVAQRTALPVLEEVVAEQEPKRQAAASQEDNKDYIQQNMLPVKNAERIVPKAFQ